jgi:hypothetical protein
MEQAMWAVLYGWTPEIFDTKGTSIHVFLPRGC